MASSFIHHTFVNSTKARALFNPATLSPVSTVFEANEAQVNAAVESSASAFEDWRTWTGTQRRDALLGIAASMKENIDKLAECESLTGRPVTEAKMDVIASAECFTWFAGLADKLSSRSFSLSPSTHSFTIREPLGVCALITSFNYPLLLAAWKLAPALATGNAVVLKPAHQTPLSTLLLASLSKDHLPPGVLNVVLGDSHIGSHLLANPNIAKASFTGSTLAGSRVAQNLAGNGTTSFPRKATLELGGKNTIIIDESANLNAAIPFIIDAAFSNAGQNCCAGSRLLIHESLHKTVIDRLIQQIPLSLTAGDPTNPSTTFPPLTDAQSLTRIKSLLSTHIHPPLIHHELKFPLPNLPGHFLPPTLLSSVPDTSPLAQTELFGPVLTLLTPFTKITDAIKRANNVPYGLAAGIFTDSFKNANLAVEGLKAGFIWINNYNDVPPFLPLGGVKASGYGKECGFEAIDEFTSVKSVHASFSA
ncbi:betaine aldehyde dehydrogenase [Rhizoclosmatium globosum]|uniref:Betaine aldehyde dehydrogenase n=1 Tax=Rhizoclosmatium globosum TaxID=329046 RepID=A0A1Y2CR27_9FUNG|nr:betaine aldehyde dehydrogenase [Rhizoclosmatium globosum]|eukprot:ORY49481.1 betaine aldehyde dehydrogenase [Rhizoclosmatium globosum]